MNFPAASPELHTSSDEDPLVGIEIGGTKLQIVLGGQPPAIIDRWRASADQRGGGTAIQQQITDGLSTLLRGRTPQAVGVGFGGPIDVTAGRIRLSHQIDGWEGFPLRDWLQQITGCPVAVENDANTAALGEAIHGAGRERDPVFYCNFGSGVGGGFIVGGNIYHGRPPGEMEFGHLRNSMNDRDGTVEGECSGWVIDRALREAARATPHGPLARRLGNAVGGEAKHVAALIADGDRQTNDILSAACDVIAFNLSHVVHLLNPAAIVIGGGLAMIGEPLRAMVASALPRFVMEALHPVPEVRLAALGEDAVPVGALELAARIATIEIPY